jgi:ureidoacrylate peracid hydrolase
MFVPDPAKTALIIIDMQYGFLEPGALMECPYPGPDVLIPVHQRLISCFREHHIPVVWVALCITPETKNLMWEMWPVTAPPTRYFAPGNHETEIVAEIAPRSGEPIIWKHGYDAFFDTDLHTVLRTLGTECTVFCGVATNYCVSTSVRGAWHRQFRPIVVSDAVRTVNKWLQEAELWVFRHGLARLMTSEELITELSA